MWRLMGTLPKRSYAVLCSYCYHDNGERCGETNISEVNLALMGLRLKMYIELRRIEPLRITMVQIGADAWLQALDESIIGREGVGLHTEGEVWYLRLPCFWDTTTNVTNFAIIDGTCTYPFADHGQIWYTRANPLSTVICQFHLNRYILSLNTGEKWKSPILLFSTSIFRGDAIKISLQGCNALCLRGENPQNSACCR